MDEITHTIEGLDRPLADLDVTPGGQVLAVTEMGKGTPKREQRLLVNGQPLPVPEPIRYPILRALDETRLLLAAFFHGPYDDLEGIYRWRLGDQNAERIGEHAGPLRGLPKGRFLSQGDTGFTILSLTDELK